MRELYRGIALLIFLQGFSHYNCFTQVITDLPNFETNSPIPKATLPPQEPLAFSNFIATTPEVRWLLEQILTPELNFQIQTLSHGHKNPHHLEITGSALAKILNADYLCQIGNGLESPWLDSVLFSARNPRLIPQAGGFCDLSLGLVSVSNRSSDSISKPTDNPHYWLGPAQMLKAARYLVDFLVRHFPMLQARFEERYTQLSQTLEHLFRHPDLGKVRKKYWMEYHHEFEMFLNDFQIPSLGALEAIPGVPPNPKRLLYWVRKIKVEQPVALLISDHQPPNISYKLREATGIKILRLPGSMSKSPYPDDYVGYQYHLLSLMIEAMGDEKIP